MLGDGRVRDQGRPAGRTLQVVGESRAGTPSDQTLHDGEAIRISTGAAVPEGATAVIRQEDADADTDGQTVTVNEAVAPGENVRNAGEDMHAGTKVLSAGAVLQRRRARRRRRRRPRASCRSRAARRSRC